MNSLAIRATAELIGTAGLLMVVIGSGIMGQQLAAGNDAIALLANALATGCGLYVLILTLGPISGAHFNPSVTIAFAKKQTARRFTKRRSTQQRKLLAACWVCGRRT